MGVGGKRVKAPVRERFTAGRVPDMREQGARVADP